MAVRFQNPVKMMPRSAQSAQLQRALYYAHQRRIARLIAASGPGTENINPATMNLGLGMSAALTREEHLAATMNLGLGMSAALTREERFAAAMNLGVDMTAALTVEGATEFLDPALMNLGVDMTAVLTRETDFVASMNLGVDMTAVLTRQTNLNPALMNLGVDMTAVLEHPWVVNKSVRFQTNKFLSRTPGGAGDQRTFTVAFWVKRFGTGSRQQLIDGAGSINAGWMGAELSASDTIQWFSSTDGALNIDSTETITDTTTWHHILLRWDTTQATTANRARIYLDGTEVTYGLTTRPAQNYQTDYNSAAGHRFGYRTDSQFPLNALIADYYFVGGLSLDPTSFISGTGAGTCHPIRYTGSRGTNGYWLTFFDTTSTTTMGRDDGDGPPGSAQGANDWTLNNMATSDSSSDVPT